MAISPAAAPSPQDGGSPLIIAGRRYRLTAPKALTAEVAFVMPSATPSLALLAIDAIRKFTAEVDYRIVVVDCATLGERDQEELLSRPRVSILRVDPPVQRWWRLETRRSVGSLINGVALEAAAAWLRDNCHVKWMFFMHDDALPIKHGWLSWLMGKSGYVLGVKASERSGMAHPSGTLVHMGAYEHYAYCFLPHAPCNRAEWIDAGELDADFCAKAVPLRRDSAATYRGQWWSVFDCDVSFDDAGEAFYVHKGSQSSGTFDPTWVRWARRNLGL